MLSLLLLACSTEPAPALADCRGPACLRWEAVALWATDPTAVVDAIVALADPFAKASVVEAVIEAEPSASPDLCPLLHDGITRRRCEAIAQEPLLWSLDPERPAQAALILGEAALVVAPGPTLHVSPLERGEAPACAPSVPLSSCRAWQGTQAAMVGDMAGAAGACGGVSTPRWRDACLMQAARAGCRRDRSEACGQAAELCLTAGVHRTPCLIHVATELAATAPSAETLAPNDWFALASRVRELEQRVAVADPILADRLAQRTWAESLMLSYGLARRVTAAPLAHLPAKVEPHVRAAVAWRLAARKDTGNLAQRSESVVQAMSKRSTRGEATPLAAGRLQIAALWGEDLPGEEEIVWIALLQDARRAWSPDVAIDTRICVLEAAARMMPVQADLLVEGLGDPDELVRWTASRLLSQVQPEHSALAHARADSSALVRQRAGR